MEIPPVLRLRSAQIFLLWSALISIACYRIHELTVSLPIMLRFLMGLVTGITLVFLCHLSYWRRERIHKEREAYSRQMISLQKEDLYRLLPEPAASSAARKRPDQFEWINVELAKVWPFLNEAVAETVKEKLQPVLDQYKMGVVQELQISSLSFGTASPRFLGVKMEEMGEDEASVEADLHWVAEKERIIIKVKTVGPDFKVKVKNISVSATVKIVLKPLADTMPCFGAILVSLSGIPVIDFDLKVADGDANALPGVDGMIDNSIRTAIEDMLVWPNRIVCPVLPGDYSFLELKPVGILDVTLIKAEGVMNTDILGKSDCFVVLFVRKKPERIKRSSTKKNSLNPVWNEGFRIEVDEPQYQSLTLQLMDEESVASAEFIGRAVIPMSDFEPHKPRELWLDMMESTNLQSNKPRARLQIVAIYEPFNKETSTDGAHENTADGSGKSLVFFKCMKYIWKLRKVYTSKCVPTSARIRYIRTSSTKCFSFFCANLCLQRQVLGRVLKRIKIFMGKEGPSYEKRRVVRCQRRLSTKETVMQCEADNMNSLLIAHKIIIMRGVFNDATVRAAPSATQASTWQAKTPK